MRITRDQGGHLVVLQTLKRVPPMGATKMGGTHNTMIPRAIAQGKKRHIIIIIIIVIIIIIIIMNTILQWLQSTNEYAYMHIHKTCDTTKKHNKLHC